MKEKDIIVIHETPEMANWMHPQTEERKKRLRESAEQATLRYRAFRAEQRKRPIGRFMDNNKGGETS